MISGSSFDNTSIHIERLEVHIHNHLSVQPEWEEEEDDDESSDDDDDGDVGADDEPESDPEGGVHPFYANGRGSRLGSGAS